MARNRPDNADVPTITTRLYQETIQILRLLAEAQEMPMIDYIHKLALKAAAEDGEVIIRKLQKWKAESKE